jgi:hypothetical protein
MSLPSVTSAFLLVNENFELFEEKVCVKNPTETRVRIDDEQ